MTFQRMAKASSRAVVGGAFRRSPSATENSAPAPLPRHRLSQLAIYPEGGAEPATAGLANRSAGVAGPGLRARLRPRANDAGLPDGLRAGIEALSGLSMDSVAVHYNSLVPERLGARAFARGRDIHLAPGEEESLPHEAWHIVQQSRGRVRPTAQGEGGVAVNDEAVLEREADVMGARAVRACTSGMTKRRYGRAAAAELLLGPGLVAQRQDSDDEESEEAEVREPPPARGRASRRRRPAARREPAPVRDPGPPPVGERYAALNWDPRSDENPTGAVPINANQSPYVDAIRRGAGDNNPARLSLAYAVDPPGPRDDALGSAFSWICGNDRLSDVASCHPTAARLVDDLGSGPATSFGRFGGAATPLARTPVDPRAAHEALGDTLRAIRDQRSGPQILRYTHGDHSLALFAHQGGLEPLESWAGGREPGEEEPADTPVAWPLHSSVLDPRPPLPLDEAIDVAAQLGHRLKPERGAALDRLSSAGIGGFEPPRSRFRDVPVSLDRRDLPNADQVEQRVAARVGVTNANLAEARAELARNRQRDEPRGETRKRKRRGDESSE